MRENSFIYQKRIFSLRVEIRSNHMCGKKKKDSKSNETSKKEDTSRTNDKDPFIEEIHESISNEVAYQRFQGMILRGEFDGLEQKEKINLLKEKSIYKNLVQKITSERKKESTKLTTSIITKTITISGFYFAIIAFILTSEFVITINSFALNLFFGSIIVLFVGNTMIIPLIFLRAPIKSNAAEYLANLNIIQSITFLIILLNNILSNTFGFENRALWFNIGFPAFILIMFILLIWQIRIRDSRGIDKVLKDKD